MERATLHSAPDSSSSLAPKNPTLNQAEDTLRHIGEGLSNLIQERQGGEGDRDREVALRELGEAEERDEGDGVGDDAARRRCQIPSRCFGMKV